MVQSASCPWECLYVVFRCMVYSHRTRPMHQANHKSRSYASIMPELIISLAFHCATGVMEYSLSSVLAQPRTGSLSSHERKLKYRISMIFKNKLYKKKLGCSWGFFLFIFCILLKIMFEKIFTMLHLH